MTHNINPLEIKKAKGTANQLPDYNLPEGGVVLRSSSLVNDTPSHVVVDQNGFKATDKPYGVTYEPQVGPSFTSYAVTVYPQATTGTFRITGSSGFLVCLSGNGKLVTEENRFTLTSGTQVNINDGQEFSIISEGNTVEVRVLLGNAGSLEESLDEAVEGVQPVTASTREKRDDNKAKMALAALAQENDRRSPRPRGGATGVNIV